MRQPRVKPNKPLTYYHVMTRTCQQAFNLDEAHCPGFKETCHQIISDMAKIYFVEIFSWVYMDNHIHLALSVAKPECHLEDIRSRYENLQVHIKYPKPWRDWYLNGCFKRFTDLSWFMWEVNQRIAKAYNRLHATKGHFWGGRFKSKVLEDEGALLRVCTYIEQNPVKAGLCEVPSAYSFCSAGRAKQELEANPEAIPKIPCIGSFKKMTTNTPEPITALNQAGEKRALQGAGRSREMSVNQNRTIAWRYIQWMDYQTRVILGGDINLKPPIEIAELVLPTERMKEWREDFDNGGSCDWRTQSYGSIEFDRQIRQLEREQRWALAHQQYLKSRE